MRICSTGSLPRFPARIKTVCDKVRTPLLALVCAHFMVACGAAPEKPDLPYRECAVDRAEWKATEAPVDAPELVAKVAGNFGKDRFGSRPRLYWFKGKSDSLLLCRALVGAKSCGAHAWQFTRTGDQWHREVLEFIVVCG
jgi:hypothetical protein